MVINEPIERSQIGLIGARALNLWNTKFRLYYTGTYIWNLTFKDVRWEGCLQTPLACNFICLTHNRACEEKETHWMAISNFWTRENLRHFTEMFRRTVQNFEIIAGNQNGQKCKIYKSAPKSTSPIRHLDRNRHVVMQSIKLK